MCKGILVRSVRSGEAVLKLACFNYIYNFYILIGSDGIALLSNSS